LKSPPGAVLNTFPMCFSESRETPVGLTGREGL